MSRRLSLRRETLAALSTDDLASVQGAAITETTYYLSLVQVCAATPTDPIHTRACGTAR